LLNIDNPFIGNHPYVEIIIHPNQKTIYPNREQKSILDKQKQNIIFGTAELGKNHRIYRYSEEKQTGRQKNQQVLTGDIKPIPMQDLYYFFFGTDTVEPKIFKSVHNLDRKIRKWMKAFLQAAN